MGGRMEDWYAAVDYDCFVAVQLCVLFMYIITASINSSDQGPSGPDYLEHWI